jgi:hypothetical protein
MHGFERMHGFFCGKQMRIQGLDRAGLSVELSDGSACLFGYPFQRTKTLLTTATGAQCYKSTACWN